MSPEILTVNTWIARRITQGITCEELWSVARATFNCETCTLWNRAVDKADIIALDLSLQRFVAGEPLSRIRGWVKFCEHCFLVTPAVLDPRPETEMIVEVAKQLEFSSVLELGVGSGCIICSIILNHPDVRALAVDTSTDALSVARRNAIQLGVNCEFRISDWCSNIKEQFDLVISNPPYVKTDAPINRDVWAYDPRLALDGGVDGCDAHRIALPQTKCVLTPGGTVLWEIGHDQKDWITNYATGIFPNATISVLDDYNDIPRLLVIKTH